MGSALKNILGQDHKSVSALCAYHGVPLERTKYRIKKTGLPLDKITDEQWKEILDPEIKSDPKSKPFWVALTYFKSIGELKRLTGFQSSTLNTRIWATGKSVENIEFHEWYEILNLKSIERHLGSPLDDLFGGDLNNIPESLWAIARDEDRRRLKTPITLNGRRFNNLVDLAEYVGINHSTLLTRISNRGWSAETITEQQLKEIVTDYL